MAQVESSELHWRAPILLHLTLYKALKLVFSTDVGGFVTGGKITSDLGSGSQGQSFGVLITQRFWSRL